MELLPRHTAYHEAGHAVACLELGISFRYITLRPRSKGVGGLVYLRDGAGTMVNAFHDAVACIAGPVAESRGREADAGDSECPSLEEVIMGEGAYHDVIAAGEALEVVHGLDVVDAIHRADALLCLRWEAALAIAGELLREQTVTRKVANELYLSTFGRAA